MSCVDTVQSKHKHKTAAVVLPVRMGSEGVALESSFKEGVKNEVLRSLCQLVNTTELALEVSSNPLQAVNPPLSCLDFARAEAKLPITQVEAKAWHGKSSHCHYQHHLCPPPRRCCSVKALLQNECA